MKVAQAPYHSDPDGLVHGSLLGPLSNQAVTTAEALAWLHQPEAARGSDFLWLHFARSNAGTSRWLRSHLGLPEAVLETVLGDEGSSRLEQLEGVVVAVVKDVVYDFAFGVSEISTLYAILSPQYLITVRGKQLRTVELVRQAVRSGTRFRSSTQLLARLLRYQVEVLEEIQRQTTDKVDHLEDRLLENRRLPPRAELATLRRVLVRLQRLLAPEPAAFYRMLHHPPEWLSSDDLSDLRQAVEEFSVVLTDLNQLNERIKLIQEELGVREADRTNRSLFTLTLVTVLAVPFNVMGALFGMNVAGIPFAQNPDGFWWVVGGVALVTLVAFLVFRKRF